MGELVHGTVTGYTTNHCHCPDCTGAMYAYQREWRERAVMPAHCHGTNSGYKNYRCRCERCRAAAAKYVRELRQRKRST